MIIGFWSHLLLQNFAEGQRSVGEIIWKINNVIYYERMTLFYYILAFLLLS